MAGRGPRRAMLAVSVLLLLALLLPPFVNVNRYRARVTEAISRALGREVTASHIGLQLLPRPGLVISNFVVAENPAYGAEPMLRADSVIAAIRLSSLWRGRLEIATLDLDTPSLNLVRRADGHWNLEELVQRASQVPTAPTSNTRPESRPRFPYVEASTGRINFKLGLLKKAFAFSDADFALWQASEDQWGIRLKARAMRGDLALSDTGVLTVDGRFQRATLLRDTPVTLKLTLSDGPLGQLTRLIYGHDRGWRGSTDVSATLTGSPAALAVSLDAQVSDFRRYDIALGEALRLRVHCTGTYSAPTAALQDVQCQAPVGGGLLTVRGNAQGMPAQSYDISVSAEQLPADRLIALARHAKKDLPADLTAGGQVEGVFALRKLPQQAASWSGGGRSRDLVLRSGVLTQDLVLGEVEFVVPETAPPKPAAKRSPGSKPAATGANDAPRLLVKPFPVPLGAPSPATASAVVDPEHYRLNVSGDAELSRLVSVANALGVATPGVGLAGLTQLDLTLAGAWVGFVPPSATGKLQLRNTTAELQGITEPLQITAASVSLTGQMVNVNSFAAAFAQGPEISGSAVFPVHCTAPETCVLQFDARSPTVSLARLDRLANPSFLDRPWYHLLSVGRQQGEALLKLRAHGRFSLARFELGTAVATNVSGIAELNAGKLRVSDLRAEILGGKHSGEWSADFTSSPPRFSGSGEVSRLSMAQLGLLMHDNWASGTIDARYSLAMAGIDPASLRDNADGSADFTWSNGSLRHVSAEGLGSPVAFSVFSGELTLRQGSFSLADCKLQSNGAVYAVKGTAAYDRTLDLRLERAGGRSYAVSGTLDKPHVTEVPAVAAQASLH